MIDELFNYIAPYAPEFAGRARGASLSEIDCFEQLVRSPFPAQYREFLRRLGRNDGGLDPGRGSPTRITDLMEYYDELNRYSERDCLPGGMTVIAVGGGPTFEVSIEQGLEDPPVYFTSGHTIKSLFCESFGKFLFQAAFDRFRTKKLPVSACYWGGEMSLNTARDILLSQGFSEAWFSGKAGFRGERGDLAVIAEQILGRPVWIRLAGVTLESLQDVGDVLIARGAGMGPYQLLFIM